MASDSPNELSLVLKRRGGAFPIPFSRQTTDLSVRSMRSTRSTRSLISTRSGLNIRSTTPATLRSMAESVGGGPTGTRFEAHPAKFAGEGGSSAQEASPGKRYKPAEETGPPHDDDRELKASRSRRSRRNSPEGSSNARINANVAVDHFEPHPLKRRFTPRETSPASAATWRSSRYPSSFVGMKTGRHNENEAYNDGLIDASSPPLSRAALRSLERRGDHTEYRIRKLSSLGKVVNDVASVARSATQFNLSSDESDTEVLHSVETIAPTLRN
jgi:hypothetical protein